LVVVVEFYEFELPDSFPAYRRFDIPPDQPMQREVTASAIGRVMS